MDQNMQQSLDPKMSMTDHGRSNPHPFLEKHPLEESEKNFRANEMKTKRQMMGLVYGAHVGLKQQMDLQLLSLPTRLPGLPATNLGADCLLGRDDEFGFEDYLGKPDNREEMPAMNQRDATEKRLGIEMPGMFSGEAKGLRSAFI
eukprot:GFYU01001091.1.p1 GENE.GFYU01001091.1~~GFYU01001091.1.p1  ORF type:complete len:145 (-),score=54.53 GFYU01001091.1:271-705(-)